MGRCRKSNFRICICYIDVWCTYLDDLDRLDGIATALAVISLNQLLLVLVCITQAAQARERVRGQVCTSAVSSAQPCTAKDPIEWLERFFAACEGCRSGQYERSGAHRDSTPREKDWRSRRRSQFCGHATCRHTHTLPGVDEARTSACAYRICLYKSRKRFSIDYSWLYNIYFLIYFFIDQKYVSKHENTAPASCMQTNKNTHTHTPAQRNFRDNALASRIFKVWFAWNATIESMAMSCNVSVSCLGQVWLMIVLFTCI
jgi:hypothetical protein